MIIWVILVDEHLSIEATSLTFTTRLSWRWQCGAYSHTDSPRQRTFGVISSFCWAKRHWPQALPPVSSFSCLYRTLICLRILHLRPVTYSHMGINRSSPHWLSSAIKCYRIKPQKVPPCVLESKSRLDGSLMDLGAFLSNYSLSVTDITASLQASLWFLYSLRSTLHPAPNRSLSCSITTFFSTQLTNSNRCFGSSVVRRRVCAQIFQSAYVEQKGHFRKVKLSWKCVTGLPLWLLLVFNGSMWCFKHTVAPEIM